MNTELKFIDYSFGYYGGRHARVHAGPYEVQILVTRMPVGGPKVSHLRQRMRKPVG